MAAEVVVGIEGGSRRVVHQDRLLLSLLDIVGAVESVVEGRPDVAHGDVSVDIVVEGVLGALFCWDGGAGVITQFNAGGGRNVRLLT